MPIIGNVGNGGTYTKIFRDVFTVSHASANATFWDHIYTVPENTVARIKPIAHNFDGFGAFGFVATYQIVEPHWSVVTDLFTLPIGANPGTAEFSSDITDPTVNVSGAAGGNTFPAAGAISGVKAGLLDYLRQEIVLTGGMELRVKIVAHPSFTNTVNLHYNVALETKP